MFLNICRSRVCNAQRLIDCSTLNMDMVLSAYLDRCLTICSHHLGNALDRVVGIGGGGLLATEINHSRIDREKIYCSPAWRYKNTYKWWRSFETHGNYAYSFVHRYGVHTWAIQKIIVSFIVTSGKELVVSALNVVRKEWVKMTWNFTKKICLAKMTLVVSHHYITTYPKVRSLHGK
jgi:hypothetical protein